MHSQGLVLLLVFLTTISQLLVPVSTSSQRNPTTTTHSFSKSASEIDRHESSTLQHLAPKRASNSNPRGTETTNGRNLSSECNACGRLNVPLLNDHVPFPDDAPDLNCSTIDNTIDKELTFTNPTLFLPPCINYQMTVEGICCDTSSFSQPRHVCETNIESNILNNYSSSVPPLVAFNDVVDVEVQISPWFVSSIDMKSSAASIHTQIKLRWKDPRLAWTVDADKCASYISARASLDVEKTDIWVPDLNLANRDQGFQFFEESLANIYADGTVTWDRFGKVQAFCSFIGLRRIPYDHVGCQFLFQMMSRRRQSTSFNLVETEGFPKGIRFVPYVQTYSEYNLVPEKTRTYFLASNTYIRQTMTSIRMNEPTTFAVELYFERARRHYILFILLPNIIFAFMSFGQFLMLIESGERISYGVSVLLIIVAQNIIASELMPISKRALWIDSFNLISMFFALFALFETMVVVVLMSRAKRIEEIQGIKERENVAARSHNSNGQNLDDDDLEDDDDDDLSDGVNHSSVRKTLRKITMHSFPKHKIIKYSMKIDEICCKAFPLGYILFIIIMFSTNHRWDDDPNAVWQNFRSEEL